ncbi:MAG TPA: hypothetical protein DD713_08000 [Nitrospiraceae bacterium]|nr:hypothetical protein [Nitrospiraceae bacterium]
MSYLDTIKVVSLSIGIIATLCGGLYFLYRQYVKKRNWYRKKLQGKWTNEGDILTIETHYMDIEIDTDKDDGEITGIICSRSLTTNEELTNISINGKLKFKKAKVMFSSVIQGKLISYGEAYLKFINGKRIAWKLRTGDNRFFPLKTEIWRID